MNRRLRAGFVAAALLTTSYALAAPQPAAARPPAKLMTGAAVVAGPTTTTSEVTTSDTTVIAPASVGDLLVVDAKQRLYISVPAGNRITLRGLDGRIVGDGDVTGITNPGEMVLSGDSATVYVAEQGTTSIAAIDTTSYSVSHLALPENICPVSVTFTGGKVWFSYVSCTDITAGGNGVLDPGTGTVVIGLLVAKSGLIRALPDRPDRLTLVNDKHIGVYDVSGEIPTTVAEKAYNGTFSSCKDAALATGGDRLVTACAQPYWQHTVFKTADLSTETGVPSGATPNAVAVSAGGAIVAAGSATSSGIDVYVNDLSNGGPGTQRRSYDFSSTPDLLPGALAFSSNHRLYAVTKSSTGGNVLHILDDATKFRTTVTVTVPKAVAYQGTVNGTGSLSFAPGIATTATVRRSDRTGSHTLPSIPVAADGTFSFSDAPGTTGPVTYFIAHPGDETHGAGEGSGKTVARPLPYDLNGDGYAETVVGAPGEDLGTIKNAGLFHVLYGSASGTTGTGSKVYTQDTPGVPGIPEANDQFGFANTSGDFNADGYADIAVSANTENVGSTVDAGVVLVFYGSATGLRTDKVANLQVSLRELYLGNALAAGDFNGDGADDLAAGGPWYGSGHVYVFHGGTTGIETSGRSYHQGSNFVPGEPGTNDGFGWSLGAGDINADGMADLAIGAMYDWEDRGWSTGSVTVLYGNTWGLNYQYDAQRFTKDTPGVPGGSGSFNPEKYDSSDGFGWQVALADFNGDGKADLASAAPGSPVTVSGVRKRDAGTVTILYSSGSQISTSNAIQISQQTAGIPGSAGQEDYFGSTLAAGDANGDGRAELAIYSPGDTYVTVIPGGPGGLVYGSAKGWTQNSSGIPGSTEAGDYWGNSLRFADIKGSGYAALIVGADGENSGQGAFTCIYSTSSGLTGTGAKYFSQNTAGVPGTAENGDGFGVFY